MIEEHDLPILKHLTDIALEYVEDGFKINFTFSPNEFFTNTVLTKSYESEVAADDDAVFFDGPSYVKAEGTTIAWNKGKDVTVKLVKKKQKKKGKGGKPAEVRTVVQAEPQPSFFNYFSAAELNEDDEDDEEAQMRLEGRMMLDFEVRVFLVGWASRCRCAAVGLAPRLLFCPTLAPSPAAGVACNFPPG